MNFSAAWSSSPVVIPGRVFAFSIVRQRASTRPAAAIFSISSGVLRGITLTSVERPAAWRLPDGRLQLVLQPEGGEGGANVVVDLARRACAVESAEHGGLVIALDQRRGLLVVDLEPVLDRVGLVVVALDEP